MEDDIPPKRVTRSRATAKTTATNEAEVKIATAATKAKVTRNTAQSTAATSKRKTRADETIEETNKDDIINDDPMDAPPARPKIIRGRKKATVAEPESEKLAEEELPAIVPAPAPTRATRKKAVQAQPKVEEVVDEQPLETGPSGSKPIRGRPKKGVQPEPEVEEKAAEPPVPVKVNRGRQKKVAEEATVAAPEPPKTTRGRPRKAQIAEESALEEIAVKAVQEPVKVTRGRATTVGRAAAAPKKSVKFEEPQDQDKENIIPAIITKDKGKDVESITGLRAKPARRPAASTRTTQTRAKVSANTKQPLSPKKATQVATVKESVSEDELATMEKTPIKPLTKSPVKFPGSILSPVKKLDLTTSLVVNRVVTEDFGSSLLGSPARRPPPSPFKDSLKTSPKRLNFGNSISPPKSSLQQPRTTESFKTSLLQSPAKRPQSPMKTSLINSSTRERNLTGATPKVKTFNVSRLGATPQTLNKCAVGHHMSVAGKSGMQLSSGTPTKMIPHAGRMSSILPRNIDPTLQELVENCEGPQIVESNGDNNIQEAGSSNDPLIGDPMLVDEPQQVSNELLGDVQSTTPTNSPPRHSIGNFSRICDENPFEDSDSEDELASNSPKCSSSPIKVANIPLNDIGAPSTPVPKNAGHRTPKTAIFHRSNTEDIYVAARSQSVKNMKERIGFTPLVQQVWMPVSASPRAPFSSSPDEDAFKSPKVPGFTQNTYADMDAAIEPTPTKSSFFEDAMSVCDEVAEVPATVEESNDDPNDGIDAVGFAPITVDEEDLDLAAEADEMSLIAIQEQDDIQEAVDAPNALPEGDVLAVSEASQEYGDENASPADENILPIDPALLALEAQEQLSQPKISATLAITTPVRSFGERERVFHTTSKVPLKPAAEDSPLKINKRPTSARRVTAQRHAPPPPSYTGVKLPLVSQDSIVTSPRSSTWSTTVTPVHTPRRDIDDQVLKGAIVYVDVHTTEGADASAVFVELLGQMGARCVKSWNWNSSASGSVVSDDGGEQSTGSNCSKIGITHVVFKDGGKRTLERVRESNGIVLCVGVGWVLDCERQQSWLPEGPYAIDTALIPRGGHRRRKSMEPRSIQNQNGIVSLLPGNGTPRSVSANHNVSPTTEFLNLPDTPGTAYKSSRRKSTLWTRSPSSDGDAKEELGGLMLSPVPATPAPETISAYAENILDGDSPDGAATPYFLKKEDLIQRTCPPKQVASSTDDFNSSCPEESSSSGVLMQRLLLARRKSLQWAPKVGSPLAKPSLVG